MTLRYLYDRDDLVAGFVARMIPYVERGFGNSRAVGVVAANDELIAGIVYHNFSPAAGRLDIAVAALPGERWLTRGTLAVIYDFPFVQCGCQAVTHVIPANDERSQRALAALGYMFSPLPRFLGHDADGIYCVLTHEDWAASKLLQSRAARQPNREAA